MENQTGEGFRVKIGGFLGHLLARGGHVADLVHAGRVQQERALALSLADGGDGLLRGAGVDEVFLRGHVRAVDAEDFFENQAVQDGDVQTAVRRAPAGEGRVDGGFVPQGQERPPRAAGIERERPLARAGPLRQLCPRRADVFARHHVELLRAAAQQLPRAEVLQPAHQPVGGEHGQAVVLHADQQHHHKVVALAGRALLALPAAVVQRGLIAVVPVGYVEPAVPEILLNRAEDLPVVHEPQAVGNPAEGEPVPRLPGRKRVQPGGCGSPFVPVERVHRAEVAARRLHQAEPVLLRLREGLLVRQDDSL